MSPLRLSILSAVVALSLSATSRGLAATWNVPIDAPTIQAGLDSAAAGDTVLVECGTYNEYEIIMKSGVVLRSETGQPDCVTIDAANAVNGGGFQCLNSDSTTVIEGFTLIHGARSYNAGNMYCNHAYLTVRRCVFRDNTAGLYGGAVLCENLGAPTFEDCGFWNNTAGSGYAVAIFDNASASIRGCTIVGNPTGGLSVTSSLLSLENTIIAFNQGLGYYGPAPDTVACTDIHGNTTGDWTGAISGYLGVDGNISVDPAFCDPAGQDYSLHADSFCASGNHPDGFDCGRIGAYDVGCGALAVELSILTASPDTVDAGTADSLLVVLEDAEGKRMDGRAGTLGLASLRGLVVAGGDVSENSDTTYTAYYSAIAATGLDSLVVAYDFAPSVADTLILRLANLTPRTWYVPADAPTIQAGLDSAVAGDTVVVACGTYLEHDITMKSGVVLRSESGEADCVTIDAGLVSTLLTCVDTDSTTVVEGLTLTRGRANTGGGLRAVNSVVEVRKCVFKANAGTGSNPEGGGVYSNGSNLTFLECVFVDNSSHQGGAISAWYSNIDMERCTVASNGAWRGGALYTITGQTTIDRSIIAFNGWTYAVWAGGVTLSCCDIYGNTDVGSLLNQVGVNGNIAVDPSFCDFTDRDLTLRQDSRCLPGNHPDGADCGVIGAYGQGCGPDPAAAVEVFSAPDTVGVGVGGSLQVAVWDSLGGKLPHREVSLVCTSLQGLTVPGGAVANADSTYTISFGTQTTAGVDSLAVTYTAKNPELADTAAVYVTHYPDSVSLVSFGDPSIRTHETLDLSLSILNSSGHRVPDEGVPPSLTSLTGRGSIGGLTMQPDTSYQATYTALAGGVDTVVAYDSEAASAPRDTLIVEIVGPAITSILDVGNDQGRQVRVVWDKELHDAQGAGPRVLEYLTWRRVDVLPANPGIQVLTLPARQSSWIPVSAAGIGKARLIRTSGALWEPVGPRVPALAMDEYASVVPTLADSTIVDGMHWSVFFISAHTADPDTVYISWPDSGYSLDNLVPAAPQGLTYKAPGILSWDECPDSDFRYFSVYGSFTDVLDESADLIGNTAGTGMDVQSVSYGHYHVTATDFSGNEGPASTVLNTVAVPQPGPIPVAFALSPNWPNPFRSTTMISFDIPEARDVRLRVFDVHGGLVRTLVARRLDPARYVVPWMGEDDSSRRVPPGIYFYRLDAGAFSKVHKAVRIQ